MDRDDAIPPDFFKTVRPEDIGWEPKGDDLYGNHIYRRPDGKLHLFQKGRPVLVSVLTHEVP